MDALPVLLQRLYAHIPLHEKRNTAISQGGVGWHIQHSLMVISGIIEQVKKSDPLLYKWKFNLLRSIVFFKKTLPRGKAKAPSRVIPREEITPTTLQTFFEMAQQKIIELEQLEAHNYFTHAYFGDLNLQQTKKMILIHTHHHLKIVEDIIKKPSSS